MYKDAHAQPGLRSILLLIWTLISSKLREGRMGVKITGVVKVDAYGHGSVRVATVLRANGIESFAVAINFQSGAPAKSRIPAGEIMVLSDP